MVKAISLYVPLHQGSAGMGPLSSSSHFLWTGKRTSLSSLPPHWSSSQIRGSALSAIHRGIHRSGEAEKSAIDVNKRSGFRLVKDERNMNSKKISPANRNPKPVGSPSFQKLAIKEQLEKVKSDLREVKLKQQQSVSLQDLLEDNLATKTPPGLDLSWTISRNSSRALRQSQKEKIAKSLDVASSIMDPSLFEQALSAQPSRMQVAHAGRDPDSSSGRQTSRNAPPHPQPLPVQGNGTIALHETQNGDTEAANIHRDLCRGKSELPGKHSRVESRYEARDDENSRSNYQLTKSFKSDTPFSIPYTTAASQFIYGFSAVHDALRAGKRKPYRLYLQAGPNRSQEASLHDDMVKSLANKANVPIRMMRREDMRLMDTMSMGRPHNGCVLEASPLPQMPIVSLVGIGSYEGKPVFNVEPAPQSKEDEMVNGTNTKIQYRSYDGRKPLIILADMVTDEGNLGSIIRSASYFGATAVVMSLDKTAKVSQITVKASAGAAESIPLFGTPNAAKFVKASKANGWMVYTSGPPGSPGPPYLKKQTVDDFENQLKHPLREAGCILVLGGEGHGIRDSVRREANVELSIDSKYSSDMSLDSLNVGVAAGILMYAFIKRRQVQPHEMVPLW